MAEAELMQFFKFSQADLEANRAGRFTDAQQARLVQEDKRNRSMKMVAGGVMLAVALVSFIGGVIAALVNHDPTMRLTFGVAFGLVVPLIFGIQGGRMLWGAYSQHSIKLASVQGTAEVKRRQVSDSESNRRYYWVDLKIGGRKFKGVDGMQNALKDGSDYRIYFIEGTDNIVSVEPLGGAR